MANENDAAHDKKLVIGIVVVSVLAVGVLGYVAWSWLNPPVQTPSHIDVTNVANSGHKTSAETPEYRNLLGEYNSHGADQARKDNNSFIASIPVGTGTPVFQPAPEPKVKQHPRQQRTEKQTKSQNNGLSEDDKKALTQILREINNDDSSAPSQTSTLAVAIEPGSVNESGGGSRGHSVSAYAGWTSSIMPQNASLRQGNQNSSMPSIELIPAFTRAAGTIDFGVDSDNRVTPAVVRIMAGPYNGAVLKAPRSELAGDGVVIHLNSMYWKGKNYTVDAYALKDDTLMANVATDVNHRYVSRILLPAVASGIGKAGDLYADANTDILTNGYSTVSSHAGMPNGTAVAGVIAGGTASEAANVLRADAAKLPATQVTVDAGQAVYVEFMSQVTTGDEVKPKGNGGTPTTTGVTDPQQSSSDLDISPASPSLTQLRAQTRERIDSQLRSQRQNSNTSPE